MIVLDENLQVLRLGNLIATWYEGVCATSQTSIQGQLLRTKPFLPIYGNSGGATFVTTNVTDFWRRGRADARYGIVCLSLPNERLREVPNLLRRLFRLPELKTKAARIGKVVRVSRRQVQYYTVSDNRLRSLSIPDLHS